MGVLSLLLGGLGVFPRFYDNFVRFRQVYVCVSLYIYSIEQPGCLGDTGCGARGLCRSHTSPLLLSSPLLFQRGRGVGGEGWDMLHVCYTAVVSLSLPA